MRDRIESLQVVEALRTEFWDGTTQAVAVQVSEKITQRYNLNQNEISRKKGGNKKLFWLDGLITNAKSHVERVEDANMGGCGLELTSKRCNFVRHR